MYGVVSDPDHILLLLDLRIQSFPLNENNKQELFLFQLDLINARVVFI